MILPITYYKRRQQKHEEKDRKNGSGKSEDEPTDDGKDSVDRQADLLVSDAAPESGHG